MRIVLASNNKGKIREIEDLLSDLNVEVISQREAGFNEEVEETGTTFEENARIKASAAYQRLGIAVIADDSGLEVDALNGEPGIYSARYTGNHEDSDADRCAFLLKKMDGLNNRKARFVCAVCCILPDATEINARGVCEGQIILESRGTSGFGYDPIFQPDGFKETMAELGDVKQMISHRYHALTELKTKLEEYLNGTDK